MHTRKFAADTKSRYYMLRLAFASLIVLSGWHGLAHAAAGDTQRISAGGAPPTLSANGRYVGFRWDGLPDPDSVLLLLEHLRHRSLDVGNQTHQ